MTKKFYTTALLSVLLVFSSALILVLPKAARAASCPAGTTAVQQVDPVFGLKSDIYNCIKDGKVVGTADLYSYVDAEIKPVQCSAGWGMNSNAWFICAWRSFLSNIGSLIIWLASWVLWAAGSIFDYAIYYTVVQLSDFLFGSNKIATALANSWMVFRDVANIAIIGMFVFIAISIILGNSTYGDKKLIARVLVIATLVNFSFLFTKIIINVSDVVASQLYQSAGLTTGSSGGAVSGTPPDGFAGRIMAATGIQTLGAQDLKNTADATQNAWVALLHGIMAACLILMAAFVLAYGALVLVTRAVLFMIIIVTAALAFATYLIPSLSDSEFGWSTWWKALLGNAALAPILMIFLAVTLTVARGLQSTMKVGDSLASLENKTGGTAGIAMLFSYLLIIGLLYASIKVASKLSGQIAGFGTVQKGLGTSVGASILAPVGLAGAAVSSLNQRRGYNKAAEYGKQAKEARRMGDVKSFEKFSKLQTKASTRAKTDINPLNSNIAKKVLGATGLSGVAAGQISTNFQKKMEHKEKHVEEVLSKGVLSKEDKEEIRSKADTIAKQDNRKEYDRHAESVETKKVTLMEVEKNLESKKAGTDGSDWQERAQDAKTKLEEQKTRAQAALEKVREEVRKQSSEVAAGSTDPSAIRRLDELRAQEKEMSAGPTREEQLAQANLDSVLNELEPHNAAITAAKSEHTQAESAFKTFKQEAAEKRISTYQRDFEHAVKHHAGNPAMAEKLQGKFDNKERIDKWRERLQAEREERKDLGLDDAQERTDTSTPKAATKPH